MQADVDRFGFDRRLTRGAICALIVLKVVLLFTLAWNRRFVMDEFAQLEWAKYLPHALFHTIWPAKAVGFQILIKPAHLIGWDAQSILLIGRMEMALLACGTLALIYGSARALGEPRVRAALIVLVLLSFSNFIERIFETRAEPLAVFFAVAALLLVLHAPALKVRTIVMAGILSGLAFLATQKALYFNVALGLALLTDAALARRFLDGISRGAWLVLGWLVPITAYCFIFGGLQPAPIAQNLIFGPMQVASHGADAYSGLRHYVLQTLFRNALLYAFCLAGMMLQLPRIGQLDERTRIALIFTIIVTAFVFAHDQPWPYVFIMALPFVALWALVPLDRIAGNARYVRLAWTALALAVAVSFVRNFQYLHIDNRDQLDLVARAEALVAPEETYFDGIGMLPNRPEPSTLWLDRHFVLKTLREGKTSEAYRIFTDSPPKVVLWSYRMDAIYPVIAPLVANSYVRIAPNIRLAGRRLRLGERAVFAVPIAGKYALYNEAGEPARGQVEIDGALLAPPFDLSRGHKTVVLREGAGEALLLPEGSYAGRFAPGEDNKALFADVYN